MTVRRARRSDARGIAGAFGRAFHDDPVMRWIFPDDTQRTARLTSMFAALARHDHLPFRASEVAADGGAITGAALWDPPGRRETAWWHRLVSIPTLMGVMRDRLRFGAAVESILARERPDEPHWYLSIIGTDPAAMGRGIGTELLRSGLARCDAAGIPAYLEASDPERGVAYYERFGFRVTGKIVVPDGGPTLLPMWRDARRSGPR